MPKDAVLRVRMTSEEFEAAERCAGDLGFESTSAYVRALLRQGHVQAVAHSLTVPAASHPSSAGPKSAVCQRAARHKPGVRCGYCGVTP